MPWFTKSGVKMLSSDHWQPWKKQHLLGVRHISILVRQTLYWLTHTLVSLFLIWFSPAASTLSLYCYTWRLGFGLGSSGAKVACYHLCLLVFSLPRLPVSLNVDVPARFSTAPSGHDASVTHNITFPATPIMTEDLSMERISNPSQ